MHPEDHVVPHTSTQEQNLSFPLLILVMSSHVKPTNNGPYSLEVVAQASGNSKLCLMIFRKIAVSQSQISIYNFFFHCCN